MNAACDGWIKRNPGKIMTTYNLPSLVKLALSSTATHRNIQAGFESAGIWPFNQEIFQDDDFFYQLQ
jgi:hypothetical protein